jgi:hypothetical protein
MARLSIAVTVALMFLSSAANAKIPVLNLGKFCSFLAIQVDRPHAQAYGFSNWQCETGNFVGLIGKMSDGERSIIASVQVADRPGDQFLLQISYPLLNGGTWSAFYTSDGYRMKLYKSGTYTVIK